MNADAYRALLTVAEGFGFVSEDAKDLLERVVELIENDPRSEEEEDEDDWTQELPDFGG
jgi:CRISPR/Cas system type I-B associated protein Csh2 (Cas7 group RAMP superfamily)